MKKILALVLILAIAVAFPTAACDRGGDIENIPGDVDVDGAPPTPTPTPLPTSKPTPMPTPTPMPILPFDGKIVVVTNYYGQNEPERLAAEALEEKYGKKKVIHKFAPMGAIDLESMTNFFVRLADDTDVKAIVIGERVPHKNSAINAIREERPDIFIVNCDPNGILEDIFTRADLTLDENNELRGEDIVAQAKKMGAEVLVHYSFLRHMVYSPERRDVMIAACEREGILFVDLTAPDPASAIGIDGARQFIMEDVPRQIAEYGKDTAFISTSCYQQLPLIKRVVEGGAIYPQPCCPSPYHWFADALDISDKVYDGRNMGGVGSWHMSEYVYEYVDLGRLKPMSEFIQDLIPAVAAKGASGRLATWPVPTEMLFLSAGTEYAIKWINGEAPQERGVVDYDLFARLCEDYTEDVAGIRMGVEINPRSVNGRSYNSQLLLVPESIIF